MCEGEAASLSSESVQVVATKTVVLTTPETRAPVVWRRVPLQAFAKSTVRELIDTLVGPGSGGGGDVIGEPAEVEPQVVMGIRELLAADSCEVWVWREGSRRVVPLDTPGDSVVGEGVEVKLDLRPAQDNRRPGGEERRRGAEEEVAGLAWAEEWIPAEATRTAWEGIAPGGAAGCEEAREGYLRKADILRARFQPEIEVLDFRGLFVGNKGLGILGGESQREPAQVDPARIAGLLLQGNGYRRSGNHARALICYQELVELDPGNKDFRFLLERTYQAVMRRGGKR